MDTEFIIVDLLLETVDCFLACSELVSCLTLKLVVESLELVDQDLVRFSVTPELLQVTFHLIFFILKLLKVAPHGFVFMGGDEFLFELLNMVPELCVFFCKLFIECSQIL